jgi:hypothetical protein
MTALLIIGGLALVFGGGLWIGAAIHTVSPIDERPMPLDADIEMHRELHSGRWTT